MGIVAEKELTPEAERFHDYVCHSSRVLAEPMALASTVRDGDTIEGLRVMDTPGR